MATSLTNLKCYEAKGDNFLSCIISIRDVVAPLQSGDEDGIHGMQACKE
jgi:hypothetical protein